jgi:hypothetical protein
MELRQTDNRSRKKIGQIVVMLATLFAPILAIGKEPEPEPSYHIDVHTHLGAHLSSARLADVGAGVGRPHPGNQPQLAFGFIPRPELVTPEIARNTGWFDLPDGRHSIAGADLARS